MNTKRNPSVRRAIKTSTFLILTLSGLVYAATQLSFENTLNVSDTPAATEKGRLVRLAYDDNGLFVKPYVLVYTDATGTPNGELNIYARRSFDGGATWDGPVLLSRDALDQATGGQAIVVQGTAFYATNKKASIFAPQSYATGAARNVLVSWTSSYCPDLTTGDYPNGGQKIDTALTPNEPYKCVWTARSTDAGETWTTEQLTDAGMDAINDVVAGSQSNNAFALAWQADPMGLQPGENEEGPGDGDSGSHTTAGTNIWYTYAANLGGANPLLRANIVQLSDNAPEPAPGPGAWLGPGASRPTLAMSGSTAAIVYEESKGGGKNVIYHSFAYNRPDVISAGTILNDPAKNARRARVVLQGDSAAAGSPLRVLAFYRLANATSSGPPSDIVVHRGLKNTALDPASTGFRPQDLEPYSTAQNLSDPGNAHPNDSARAHRAIVRGGFIAFAYTHAPDLAATSPSAGTTPTATYDLYVRTSNDSGATWGAPRNLSNLPASTLGVGEPRLVPTSATIVNPLTGVPDAGDTQNTNTFYVAFGTYMNDAAAADQRIFVTRSTDQGASYEPLVALPGAIGQSEAQLRVSADGESAAVLWMQEIPTGGNRDVMLAIATPGFVPDPAPTVTSSDSGASGCVFGTIRDARGSHGPIDPTLPAMALVAALLLALSRTAFGRQALTPHPVAKPFDTNRILIAAPLTAHGKRNNCQVRERSKLGGKQNHPTRLINTGVVS